VSVAALPPSSQQFRVNLGLFGKRFIKLLLWRSNWFEALIFSVRSADKINASTENV
jgi:hypothetical protein